MEDIESTSSSCSNTFGEDIIAWSLESDQDGSVSPSSDSGLGSEDENPAHIYGNISPLKIPDKRTLDELTKSLTIDCSSHDSCETTTVAKQIRKNAKIDSNNNIVNCSTFQPEEGESLSLLLTSQNPSRIDVMTIRRNKVSKSKFEDYCCSLLEEDHHQMKQNNSSDTLCDKKLLAINHLYNDESSEAILSVRGTVRGIKNRVRAGIQTFALEKPVSKDEYGQCVMYVTSLGIVRSTKARCSTVRKILRNLSVRVFERDVFMCNNHCMDLKERLGQTEISLPQVFIHGHLLGDANTIEQLNESGELRKLLRPFQDPDVVSNTCDKCGGYGMYPCTVCEGSRRSSNNSQRNGYITLKCTQCDKSGLMLCDLCN